MAYSVTDGKGGSILGVSGVMITLCTLSLGLRFWSRCTMRNTRPWWDDWLALAALPFIWAICGLSIYWVYIGFGQHIRHVHTPHRKLGLILFAVDFVYNTGLTLVKLSVLMFYVRIFGAHRGYRKAFWAVGIMVIAWCIAIDCVALFACTPVSKNWDSRVPGHCNNRQANFVGAAISNILIDFILLLLPVPILWNLQTNLPRRVTLVGVFAAGYLVPVLSIVRFVFIFREGTDLNKDLTWNGVTSEILLVLEVSIALISSCIPSIFNLVKHVVMKGYAKYSHLLSRSSGSRRDRKKGFLGLSSRAPQISTLTDDKLMGSSLRMDFSSALRDSDLEQS